MDERGNLQYQAPSPPAWNAGIRLDGETKSPPPSPLGRGGSDSPATIHPSSLIDAMSPRSMSSTGTDKAGRPSYVSKIGILPSSLPHYHKLTWEAKKSGKSTGNGLSTSHAEFSEPHKQTDAEKAETRSRLNPHAKNGAVRLGDSDKPAPLTQLPQKKTRTVKWQFGIRSRNSPIDAIACIYRALVKCNAEWRFKDEEDDGLLGEFGLSDR